MKETLALDADNVLLMFSDYWHKVAEKRVGRKLPLHPRHYHFMDRHGLTRDEYNQVWDYFREIDGWSNVPFYPGTGDILDALSSSYKLVVVTGIPDEAVEPRKRAFVRLGMPISEIYATGHRDNSKTSLLTELKPTAFVDDRAIHLGEAANANIPHLFWVDQGYDRLNETPKGTIRIKSLRELVTLL